MAELGKPEKVAGIGIFPKELRYFLANRIDKKVWISYVLMFLVVGGGILALSYIKPTEELSEEDVIKIKKRYAKLELNQPKKEEPKKEEKDEKKDEKKKSEKTKVDRKNETKEQKQVRKKETEESRAKVREQLKKDIEQSGLFAELTAAGNEGDEIIDDVLAQGDEVDLGDIDLESSNFTSKPTASSVKRVRKGTQIKSGGLGKQVIKKAKVKKVQVVAEVKLSKPEKISGDAAGEDSRSAQSIEKVIARIKNKIKLQFEKFLRQDPNLSGKVNIQFTILADGGVADATIENSSLNHSSFERRLLSMIKRLKFPPATAKIQITYPFVFSGSQE